MRDRPVLRCSQVPRLGTGLATGSVHITLCAFGRSCLTPTFFRERADNSPHTGPFGAGKNVAQSADMPRPAAALSRSLLTRPSRSGGAGPAPACRHPPCPPPAAAAYNIWRGSPKSPRPPRMLAPSIPRGLRQLSECESKSAHGAGALSLTFRKTPAILRSVL